MMTRAYDGTCHKLSHKHLQRYVDEFTGRHNIRNMNIEVQMALIAAAMTGQRLRFDELTADNGLPQVATAG